MSRKKSGFGAARSPAEPMRKAWLRGHRRFVRECTRCQQKVEPDWLSCVHCGFRLAEHCPFCGSSLPPAGATLCAYCGAPIPQT
ncbi:MAG: zinc-ribbon domain-containing protein [Chloroflexi bacterium]|nr:zinc-ribbon domain-containing protein [Chloroflexota bacterium]